MSQGKQETQQEQPSLKGLKSLLDEEATDSFLPKRRTPLALRLLPLTLLTGALAVWGFVGTIPDKVVGRSIILVPRQKLAVESLQANAGRVVEILVQPGEQVKQDQILFLLDVPDLKEALATQQQRLRDLETENVTLTQIENERLQLQQISSQRQILANNRQIESNKLQIQANERQRQAFLARIRELDSYGELLAERTDSIYELIEEEVMAPLDSRVLDLDKADIDNANEIATIRADLRALDASDEELLASNRSLEAQNVSLEEEDKTLLNQNRQNQVNRFNGIRDQKRQIINQQVLIEQYNKVRSPKDGIILDISTDIGLVVGKGDRLATLEVAERTEQNQDNPKTVAIAFFSPGDINRIQEGMTVEVVPGIQPRARFGGIEGKVVEVGKESIPEETMTTIVGENQLLAESLANLRTTYTPTKPDKTHAVVPVRIVLERDENNPTGYKWTGSAGFFFPITDGTTGETFAFIEERSLVSFIIPALRKVTGIFQRQTNPCCEEKSKNTSDGVQPR